MALAASAAVSSQSKVGALGAAFPSAPPRCSCAAPCCTHRVLCVRLRPRAPGQLHCRRRRPRGRDARRGAPHGHLRRRLRSSRHLERHIARRRPHGRGCEAARLAPRARSGLRSTCRARRARARAGRSSARRNRCAESAALRGFDWRSAARGAHGRPRRNAERRTGRNFEIRMRAPTRYQCAMRTY